MGEEIEREWESDDGIDSKGRQRERERTGNMRRFGFFL